MIPVLGWCLAPQSSLQVTGHTPHSIPSTTTPAEKWGGSIWLNNNTGSLSSLFFHNQVILTFLYVQIS